MEDPSATTTMSLSVFNCFHLSVAAVVSAEVQPLESPCMNFEHLSAVAFAQVFVADGPCSVAAAVRRIVVDWIAQHRAVGNTAVRFQSNIEVGKATALAAFLLCVNGQQF
jgi:hypothetical protein